MEKSDLFEEKMQPSSFSREYLEDLCNQISVISGEIKISSKPGSAVLCSINQNPDLHSLGEDIQLISVSPGKFQKAWLSLLVKGRVTKKRAK